MLGWLIASLLAVAPASPLEPGAPEGPGTGALPSSGESPLERTAQGPDPSGLPINGRAPIRGSGDPTPPVIDYPMGRGPARTVAPPPDPKRTNVVRIEYMAGMTARITTVDPMMTTGVEFGRIEGFSGSFHTSFIASTPPRVFFDFSRVVRAFDVPTGVGGVFRGRLGKLPVYGSVGLSAGVLVHRAKFEGRVTHRVDPDFRIPLRFHWHPTRVVGLSLGLLAGYSVRKRVYETGGNVIYTRNAFRIALLVGLHFDVPARRRDRNK